MALQKKALGFWSLTSLVAGNMIGSGIFLLPSALAQYDAIGLIGWSITLIGALCFAWVFAFLGRIQPALGGPYAYCRTAFGDFIGFQVTISYWTASWMANAAILVALMSYLSFFIPAIQSHAVLSFSLSSGILWIVIGINILGMKQARFFQVFATILKLIPLFSIAFIGLFFIHPHYLFEFHLDSHPSFSFLTASIVLTFWSFLGMEVATIPVEDVEDPQKNIPKATLTGVSIAGILYVLSTISIMGMIPPDSLAKSSSPFADAAQIMFGSGGGILIALIAICALIGSLIGAILILGIIPKAAARDKILPRFFGQTNTKGAYTHTLILSGVLTNLLLAFTLKSFLIDQFTFIITLAILAMLIPYLYTSMATLILLSKQKEQCQSLPVVKPIIIASCAFGYILWVLFGSGQKNIFYGTCLMLAITPLYAFMQWKRHAKVNL